MAVMTKGAPVTDNTERTSGYSPGEVRDLLRRYRVSRRELAAYMYGKPSRRYKLDGILSQPSITADTYETIRRACVEISRARIEGNDPPA